MRHAPVRAIDKVKVEANAETITCILVLKAIWKTVNVHEIWQDFNNLDYFGSKKLKLVTLSIRLI